MSNLRIDNIAPSAGGTYRNAPRGIAAAWVNFNGTSTVAIRDSVNVGSITDVGTGLYTINLSSAFATANYSVTALTQKWDAGDDGNATVTLGCTSRVLTASSFPLASARASDNGTFDTSIIAATCHGDLA